VRYWVLGAPGGAPRPRDSETWRSIHRALNTRLAIRMRHSWRSANQWASRDHSGDLGTRVDRRRSSTHAGSQRSLAARVPPDRHVAEAPLQGDNRLRIHAGRGLRRYGRRGSPPIILWQSKVHSPLMSTCMRSCEIFSPRRRSTVAGRAIYSDPSRRVYMTVLSAIPTRPSCSDQAPERL
jgi:hypothetical protein